MIKPLLAVPVLLVAGLGLAVAFTASINGLAGPLPEPRSAVSLPGVASPTNPAPTPPGLPTADAPNDSTGSRTSGSGPTSTTKPGPTSTSRATGQPTGTGTGAGKRQGGQQVTNPGPKHP